MFGLVPEAYSDKRITDEEIREMASLIKKMRDSDRTLSLILRYIIDAAADQYISENFHNYSPELLKFFSLCETDNEEVRFLAFVESHKDSLVCRNPKCDKSQLIGKCPIMYCPTCSRRYFLDIEKLTDLVCKRCAAFNAECTEEKRKLSYRIFFATELAEKL